MKCSHCDFETPNKIALANHWDNTHRTPTPDQTEIDDLDELIFKFENYTLQIGGGVYLNDGPKLNGAEFKTAISKLTDERVVAELEDVLVGKPGIGPNGENMGVNLPDLSATWNKITARLNSLKKGI